MGGLLDAVTPSSQLVSLPSAGALHLGRGRLEHRGRVPAGEVADGKIHYFLGGSGVRADSGSASSAAHRCVGRTELHPVDG
jgi:hypothetical protein